MTVYYLTELIDGARVATLLDVPRLTVDQLVIDDKLFLYDNWSFSKKEVEELSKDQTYLDTLRNET